MRWTQLADGAFAALVRCCEDELTDSWCTVYVHMGISADEVLAAFERHRKSVEELHAKAEEIKNVLAGLATEAQRHRE